jgi:glutaredoxin
MMRPPSKTQEITMKFVRWLLGRIVLTINWLTWPRAGVRAPEQQQAVEANLAHYALYQFHACPFCVKVRRALRRLNLPMTLRDAKPEGAYRTELQQQGGAVKVPCLRIEHPDGRIEWMYESSDIIAYLEQTFPLQG